MKSLWYVVTAILVFALGSMTKAHGEEIAAGTTKELTTAEALQLLEPYHEWLGWLVCTTWRRSGDDLGKGLLLHRETIFKNRFVASEWQKARQRAVDVVETRREEFENILKTIEPWILLDPLPTDFPLNDQEQRELNRLQKIQSEGHSALNQLLIKRDSFLACILAARLGANYRDLDCGDRTLNRFTDPVYGSAEGWGTAIALDVVAHSHARTIEERRLCLEEIQRILDHRKFQEAYPLQVTKLKRLFEQADHRRADIPPELRKKVLRAAEELRQVSDSD